MKLKFIICIGFCHKPSLRTVQFIKKKNYGKLLTISKQQVFKKKLLIMFWQATEFYQNSIKKHGNSLLVCIAINQEVETRKGNLRKLAA